MAMPTTTLAVRPGTLARRPVQAAAHATRAALFLRLPPVLAPAPRPTSSLPAGAGRRLGRPAARPQVAAAAAAPSAAPSLAGLRLALPVASAALLLGLAAQVSAPSAFLTSAWAACPCPHIQTAAQLLGAGLALPAAAAGALGKAAKVGPSRLASPTYLRLAAGLAAWAAVTAAGLALASPRLALNSWYVGGAVAGLGGLGLAAGHAAVAYGGGGVSTAAAAVPAALSAAATLDADATPVLARAYGGLSTAGAVGAAYLAALGAAAARTAAPPPVRVLLAFSGAAAALFAAVATGVLADAVSRGRGGASTFVSLARGCLIGGGLAAGALAGLVARSVATGKVPGAVLPVAALAAWVVGLAGVGAWHLYTEGPAATAAAA